MSAYAMEATKELTKAVRMSTKMSKIKTLLENIEEMKNRIVLVSANENMPFVIKTKKLCDMRECLFIAEHAALKLIQEEIELLGDCDGDGDGHDE